MSLLWKKTVPAILLGILGAAAGAFFWLLGTASGASWAVRTAIRRAPVRVEVGGVSGRLLGSFRLTSLEVRWPSGTATADSAGYRLRPLSLLQGAVSLEYLAVEGASVTIREAERDGDGATPFPPTELRWPEAAGISGWLDVGIDSFRLSGTRIHPPGRDPILLEDLSARVAWRNGTLAVSDFAAKFPFARIEGSLAAGFSSPSLRADLTARLEDARDGMESITLSTDLGPSSYPRGLAGPWKLSAAFSDSPDIHVVGEARMERDRAKLLGVSLSLPEQPAVVTGRAEAVLSGEEVDAVLELSLHDLDLFFRTGTHTKISGDLALSGGPDGYEGSFSLGNPGRGISGIRLRGEIAGDGREVTLSLLRGAWIGGEIAGDVTLSWADEFLLEGSLNGRNLDPERIDPGWPGRIHFALRGSARKAGISPLHAEIDGRVMESTLRGRILSGEVRALLDEEGLKVSRLELHGDGFDVSARGRLRERLVFSADISRLSGLLPGTEGSAQATGWARWRDGPAGGAVTTRGKDLDLKDIRADSLSLSATWEGRDRPFTVEGAARGITSGDTRLESASLQADGTLDEHDIRLSLRWEAGEVEGRARGGYRSGRWEGTVAALTGSGEGTGGWSLTNPASLAVSPKAMRISRFHVVGTGGQSLRAEADLSLSPLRGSVEAEWEDIDPALADPWLGGLSLSGASTGKFRASLQKDGRITLSGQGELSGTALRGSRRLTVRSARVAVEGDEGGSRATLAAELDGGAAVEGSFRSPVPARIGLPQRGTVQASIESLDLALFSPWMPEGMTLAGTLSGQAEGDLLPERKFDLRGKAGVKDGKLAWKEGGKEIEVPLRSADLAVIWRDDAARGEFSLSLEEHGRAQGKFRLPIPAQAPPGVRRAGEVSGSLSATLREKGLLPAFFPGMIQESSGSIDLDLTVGGTWEFPDLTGTVSLAEAGGYLPAAGIRLHDLAAKGRISGREIRIETLKALSGEGSIEGTAEILLPRGDLFRYEATLDGENFQTVNLPEFRMSASPHLSIEGTKERLRVRGEISVPDLLIYGRQTPPPVRRSDDVVIVDRRRAAEKKPPLSFDIEVKVALGKHVLVKAEGIDARLEGNLMLRTNQKNDFIAQGEIRAVEGAYSTYGVRLKITRGRLFFPGGPVERPTLDILATRKTGDVTAGVQVTGTPQRPVVELYSEPPMPDTDVLSYIVLGHPLGEERGQGDALMLAANALLPMTQSAVLQDRLERRFGIDVLDVQSGEGEEAGSTITVGKYLNPDLYISYGQSIFTDSSEVTVRYDFLKRWQIESQMGEESGVDLFYKIEFR